MKPHKLLSMLLALVMLVSLMPGTVLAASPDASNVYVDGDKNFYNSTRLYYINGDSDGNFTGNASNYNAAYDPATGTLTLKDYNGKGIMVGGVGRTDITVKLVGTNIINDGSLENAVGGDITVTSSDGGTLSITRTLNGSNAAIGIETGLSASYTTGNVTIKGNAKVTINMTHNGTRTYEKAYGIFAKENITISENASVDITCATPNNTTGGGNCNGLYAAKDVTIDTNGTIKIDVTNAGKDKDNGYSYGVYHMRTATLTKVGNMEVQWKKEDNNTNYPGGAFTKGATFSDTDHAINVDTTNCYASYRYGTPYTVTVQNGTVTGPGVPNASGSGMFLENDTVSIKADTKTGNSGENIPFQKWTSSDVTITNPTSPSNSFTVPGKDVTVTAMHSPFYGTPVFTRTSDSSGTIAFQTVVKPDNSEFFEYVKNGETTYNGLYPQPTTTSGASPYEYSVSASTYYAGDIQYLNAGDYRMAVTLNGERYLSDPFTVDYTAAPTTYTVSFDANGGTGTMADVTGVSGEYTLPANGFTAPAGKQFKGWATSADGTAIPGTTIDVTADTTLYAIWENIPVIEHAITVTNGKATVGAGTEISKAAEGTTVTLTANAASDGQMFDKWEVVSGSITLADATSETTTFVMPAGAVSVKATYRFYITINLAAGEGSGTMEPLILKSNTYGYYDLIAPDCTFTAPANKVFDKWQFSEDDSYLKPGDTKYIWSSANGATLTAIWKDAPVTYYTVSFDSNGGTGTMADVTGISGEYTLPENGFTAPDGKHFKCWSVDGVEKAVGDKITVTANTTVTAVWEAIEYNVTVTGGTASVGAGTPITKATMGTTVTLTANAAPSGQMFDKWEVVSGSITLADANSATTTFTMPAGAVSVKATYKDAPHTHTFDQEIIKDEALKTAADCTHDAVYYKSCECGKIGTAETAGTFEREDSALGHDWSEGWSKDADKHWHECNRCHEKKDNAAHGYKSGVCTVCGAKDPDYKPPENPFVDVSESSVYYDAILWAYYHEPQQITGGYTATEFRPGNPCTRGQVVTFLWRAAGCPEPTGDTSMFNDASSIAAPYQKAVAWAVENGITTGFADGTFRPNDSVTRAQFVTFLWRYENRPATSGSIAGFTDAASIAEPYQQAVAWAVEKGITTGYNDGSFRPNATCTRWAVVLFMYRDMT